MRLLPAVSIAAVAGLALASPAAAINSYNAAPAPERTEVGAYVALWDKTGDGVPDRFDWVCSGAMVDRDTFLTAAHCTTDWPEGTRHFISLEQDVQGDLDALTAQGLTPSEQAATALARGWVVEATPHWDPAYPGPSSNAHDIAVLDTADRAVSPADVWTFTPATLPAAGLLDTLPRKDLEAARWWAVGYGTQEAARGPGGLTHPGGGIRMKAQLGFNTINKSWVRLSMIATQGWGGACYGDSGGPDFLEYDGHLVLAATTITGDGPCYATNVVYRTDTASARAFLAPFVALP